MPEVQEEAEQLALFELGVDVSRLKARAAALASSARAASTGRAYASDWKIFSAWCVDAGRESLPARPDTVRLFLTHELERRKVATVNRRVHAIAFIHKKAGQTSPIDDRVTELMSGAARELGTKPQGKTALTPEMVRRMVNRLTHDKMAIRDRALLLLGFSSGMRRSELSALDIEDLRFVRQGVRVFIGKGKTDQEAKGRVIGIFKGKRQSTDPVFWLRQWLKASGNRKSGPLFLSFHFDRMRPDRLQPEGVLTVVKRSCELVGLDARDFGAHSMRAGMITTAVEAGADVFAIMQRSGHRSLQTIQLYVRPASVFRSDVMAKAL